MGIINNYLKKLASNELDLLELIKKINAEDQTAIDKFDEILKNKIKIGKSNAFSIELHSVLDGYANAEYRVGLLFAKYHDIENSYYWYKKAAEHESIDAMHALALGYTEFANNPEMRDIVQVYWGRDSAKEEYWLEKAAKLDDAKAQYNLAFMMKVDRGNIDIAVFWYEKAINNYNYIYKIKSMEKLAEIYGNKEYVKHYSLIKQETLLLEIVCFKQRYINEIFDGYDKIYESALISLAVLYRNEYQKDGNKHMLKKAVYCLFLSYCRGAKFVKSSLLELPYIISDAEMDVWSLQANRLEFDKNV